MLVPALVFLPGCPFECGGFDGAGDVMYRRGDDALFLCLGGGFTASVAKRAIEGRFERDGDVIVGANGTTGAREFSLQRADDGTWSGAEIGAGWTEATLDVTELDHAHVQCTDLEMRAWWTTPAGALPATTAFSRPAGGFASITECRAAQQAGTYPAGAKCEDAVLLCANNRAVMLRNGVIASGSYTADLGEVSASSTLGQIDGVFAADGTLHSGTETWRQVSLDEADRDLVAAGCGAGT